MNETPRKIENISPEGLSVMGKPMKPWYVKTYYAYL